MSSYSGFNPDDEPEPTLRVCEVAQLWYKGMVLHEIYHNVTVSFTDTASFNVSNIELDEATIESNSQTTSLADYISAKNCDGSANANGNIAPNEELCVEIYSDSPDVLIESITSMVSHIFPLAITQTCLFFSMD